MADIQFQAERPDMCERVRYVVVPEFAPGSSAPTVVQNGSPGRYRAVLVFTNPGQDIYREDTAVGRLLADGQSQLAVWGHDVQMLTVRAGSARGEQLVHFRSNDAGAICRAEMELDADNLPDAEATSYTVVARILSMWSALYHVGVVLSLRYTEEVRTGQMSVILGNMGKVRALDPRGTHLPSVTEEWVRLFSTYRKALNASDDFYRCLCLFKVADAVVQLRGKRTREAVQRGESPFEPSESLPETWGAIAAREWERENFVPVLVHAPSSVNCGGQPAGGARLDHRSAGQSRAHHG